MECFNIAEMDPKYRNKFINKNDGTSYVLHTLYTHTNNSTLKKVHILYIRRVQ